MQGEVLGLSGCAAGGAFVVFVCHCFVDVIFVLLFFLWVFFWGVSVFLVLLVVDCWLLIFPFALMFNSFVTI